MAVCLVSTTVPLQQASAADVAQAAEYQAVVQQADLKQEELGTIVKKMTTKLESQVKTVGEKAVGTAKDYIGTPYRAGGSTPAGFDCSGFTMYVYSKMGIKLTHRAQAQYNETSHKVAKSDLKAGDLVFFGSSTGSISHVGIYVGKGKFIHSPQTGEYVRIDSLSDRSNYVGAARPY